MSRNNKRKSISYRIGVPRRNAIWEQDLSTYKTTVIELQQLKDRHIKRNGKRKDTERKHASIKEVYELSKSTIRTEQTKTKLKKFNQEKKTTEVIKALRSMTKIEIDSIPGKEIQIKQLQSSLISYTVPLFGCFKVAP